MRKKGSIKPFAQDHTMPGNWRNRNPDPRLVVSNLWLWRKLVPRDQPNMGFSLGPTDMVTIVGFWNGYPMAWGIYNKTLIPGYHLHHGRQGFKGSEWESVYRLFPGSSNDCSGFRSPVPKDTWLALVPFQRKASRQVSWFGIPPEAHSKSSSLSAQKFIWKRGGDSGRMGVRACG